MPQADGPCCALRVLRVNAGPQLRPSLAITNMFTEPGTWHGGSIELLMLFRGESSVVRERIGSALWAQPCLDGPYLLNGVEPEEQIKVAWNGLDPSYGVATLTNQGRVAFCSSFVEDEDGLWLYAGIPMGALGYEFPVGAYPFGSEDPSSWLAPLHEWFVSLAKQMYASNAFDAAVIGWLTTMEVEELASGVIPDNRYHTYIACGGGGVEVNAINRRKSPCGDG